MKALHWPRTATWRSTATAILLLALSALAAWTGWQLSRATARAEHAWAAVSALETAAGVLDTSEQARRGYTADGQMQWPAGSQATTLAFEQALDRARAHLPSKERNGLANAQREHERYRNVREQYYTAVDAGDYEPAVVAAVKSEAHAAELNRVLGQALEHGQNRAANARPAGIPTALLIIAGLSGSLGLLLVGSGVAHRRRGDNRAAAPDPITGLHGHRRFHEVLARDAAAAAARGDALSCVRIDLDDFSDINQAQGHRGGDALLHRFGAVLRAAPTGNATYRTGGDEFALILRNQDAKQARMTVERLRLALKGPLPDLRFSAGIAQIPPEGGDALELIARAGAALAEAKRQGKYVIVSYEDVPPITASVIPAAKSDGLKRLIAERGVTAVFQPILRADPAGVLAYEALSRPDPRYGLAHAGEMFDIAERLGLTTQLDEVCRAAIFARAVDLPREALLFVNVSPRVLDRGLLNPIAFTRTVLAAGLRPDRVVLEITERAVDRLPVLLREARALRDHGFKLALDDVGAGNSGLEMLRRLPVDVVKIDREVIVAALTNITARAVLAALTAFARESRSLIIAEGIETEEALDFVLRAGADAVQGFLLAKPDPSFIIPTEAALQLLRRGKGPAAVHLLRVAS